MNNTTSFNYCQHDWVKIFQQFAAITRGKIWLIYYKELPSLEKESQPK